MSSQIVNDRLVGVPFFESPNCGGPLVPELLVLHYTVIYPASGVVSGFRRPSSRASAHLVLDFDGSWTQMVPFDRQAWHAGESVWRGRPSLNHWTLGIEVVNPGPVKVGETITIDTNNRVWKGGYRPSPADRALMPAGCPPAWKHWATYTEAQIVALERVCRLLVAEYRLREIVRHSDVSPGRKFDPGPLFPIDRIRQAAFGSHVDPSPALPTLRLGPKSELSAPYVMTLQERLNVHGADPPLKVDGDFGDKTKVAVMAFQRRRGIDDDGVVGKQTWPLLLASP